MARNTAGTFAEQMVKLKLNTNIKLSKFLKGKKIKIVTNSGGHNYGGAGTIVTLDGSRMSVVNNSYINQGVADGNAIYFYEFEVIMDETIEEINAYIKQLEVDKKEIDQEITNYRAKMAFMEANGLEKYDEDEFKVYSTLEALENPKTSKMEKAKIIAKLIKG